VILQVLLLLLDLLLSPFDLVFDLLIISIYIIGLVLDALIVFLLPAVVLRLELLTLLAQLLVIGNQQLCSILHLENRNFVINCFLLDNGVVTVETK
jgi:hypothetical protein